MKLKKYERGRSSVIIDVTDTYFEGGSIEDTPRRGKDGYGFPIMMRTYPGNISNFLIFRDLHATLAERGLNRRKLQIKPRMRYSQGLRE